MKRIGVVANCYKSTTPDTLKRLLKKAEQLGAEVVTCDESADLCAGLTKLTGKRLSEQIDLLLALGGDGTVLRAARILAGRETPILGVNLGGLGFMTSVPIEELETALERVNQNEHVLSERSQLTCEVIRDGQVMAKYRALNDMALGWGQSPRVVTLGVSIDGEEVTSFICDGLLLSTPTGSTAHSLSAGGPILHPNTAAFVLSPICPHTLSNRPLVISDDSKIEVSVLACPKDLLLAADGQSHQSVTEGDVLKLQKSSRAVRFVRLPDYSYFSLLRQKLHWRGSAL